MVSGNERDASSFVGIGNGIARHSMPFSVADTNLERSNVQKVGVALEEMELEYELHTINILKNNQFTPEFIAINANSKIPALVDPNDPDGKPLNIMESGVPRGEVWEVLD